jgi:DNA-binding IclR family transcriptional regulator
MRMVQLAKATSSGTSTAAQWLRRMKAKGLIERQDGSGGWTAAPRRLTLKATPMSWGRRRPRARPG